MQHGVEEHIMPDIIKVAIFIAVSLLGFFSVSIVLYMANFTGTLPEAIPDESLTTFRTAYFGGTMWAWIAGVAMALGYFFVKGKFRIALLWAPVLLPVIFAVGSLRFFQ